MSIQENALLVKVSIGVYTNGRVDNESAEELASTHHVEKYIKARRINLPEYSLDTVKSISNDIRSYVQANTLPFLDRGVRLLPSTNYFSFIQGLSRRKEAFDIAVDTFFKQLPVYIAEAKQKFGNKFDENNLPSIERLRAKFYVDPVFMPIADHNDWRIALEDTELAKLKQNYESNLEQINKNAVKHLWTSIKERITHTVEKLSNSEARIYQTLLPNLTSTAELILQMNLTHDAELTDICNAVINCIPPNVELKKQPEERAAILVALENILRRIP